MATLDSVNNLLNLTQVREHMGTTGSTGENAKLTNIINAVSHRFNSETGRLLKSRAHTTYHDGNGGSVMHLDQYPVVSVSTNIDIRVDSDWDFTTGDKVSSTNIRIYANEGKVYIDNDTFDVGEQSVKVVYTAGYTVSSTSTGSTVGTIPGDLQYAALEFVQFLWRRESGSNVGIRSESVEGGSITYEDGMPWSVRQVLDRYRDRRYG
jgi:hypothetical protein